MLCKSLILRFVPLTRCLSVGSVLWCLSLATAATSTTAHTHTLTRPRAGHLRFTPFTYPPSHCLFSVPQSLKPTPTTKVYCIHYPSPQGGGMKHLVYDTGGVHLKCSLNKILLVVYVSRWFHAICTFTTSLQLYIRIHHFVLFIINVFTFMYIFPTSAILLAHFVM